jgi:hypothetical protein
MWGFNVPRAMVIAALLLFNQCGGRSTDSPSSATAGVGGRLGSIDDCVDAAEEAGCGGAAAEELAPYARLRTGCSSRPQVMRDAGPVSICYKIR